MRVLACLIFLSFGYAFADAALRLAIGEFSLGRLAGWETKAFKGQTHYALVGLEGHTVLRADSHGSASGLVRELRVDLEKTPYLNWSWRVENTLGELNEQSKAGDDYAARLYVVVSGGLMFWRSRSLDYVWASTTPVGTNWPNAYAGANVRMLALHSGTAELGRWRKEKRNIRDDLKAYFGEDIRYLDAVALMTDTDDSGRQAVAYYGDIYFSSE